MFFSIVSGDDDIYNRVSSFFLSPEFFLYSFVESVPNSLLDKPVSILLTEFFLLGLSSTVPRTGDWPGRLMMNKSPAKYC